jgi:predicted metal-dependent hydrolase
MTKEIKVVVEKIIRSNRKSIAIQVTNNGTIIIKAPKQASDEAINIAITRKIYWIEEKLKMVQSRPKFKEKEFVNGEGFLYLGNYYRLQINKNQKEPLILKDKYFCLSENYLHKAREVFIGWYKEKALEVISERVKFYAKMNGFRYNKINITEATTRWGSCSVNGNLNFSWKLIMAPLSVIDYVVVHELAHLEEKHHGEKFWDKVRLMMPNYEEKDTWLKENGHMLNV